MNVLVTGAAGFIGSHIANALALRGDAVIAVDDLSGVNVDELSGDEWGNLSPAVTNRVEMNCADKKGMQKVFEEHAPVDMLIHLAANAREGASQYQPASVTESGLTAYIATLEAAVLYEVRRVVLFSTMAVYGKQKPPFREDYITSPVDVYGHNKNAMEGCTDAMAQAHKLDYVIIRPHNVFGEQQTLSDKLRNVAAIFMNRIMRHEPLFIYGDGQQQRAFSYIGDSLPAFIKAIDGCGDALPNCVINVGGKEYITVNQLADVVKQAMGVDSSYKVEYYADRPCEVKNAFSTYGKSVELLDYVETVGWRAGIDAMAKWALKKGPQAWRVNDPLILINESTPKPWQE